MRTSQALTRVLSTGLLALVLLVAGCTGPAAAPAPTMRSATYPAELELLHFDDQAHWSQLAPCAGEGEYSDIREGATVTVRDEHDTIIGAGLLGPGLPQVPGGACVFRAAVGTLPETQFYQLLIGDRTVRIYSFSEMTDSAWSMLAYVPPRSS